MEENLKLYNDVRKVPPEALKKITGGRLNGMSDINPMWRIKTLTERFGPCGLGWHYEIKDRELVPAANGEVKCFVTVHLSVLWDKESNDWGLPIVGFGGSSFVSNEKNGPYVNDECYKMALTDALGNACKNLGIGADVYFDKDRTKYADAPLVPAVVPAVVPAAPSVDITELRAVVEQYMAKDDDYREQIFQHYNLGSFEDFTDRDIKSIAANLKKHGKI